PAAAVDRDGPGGGGGDAAVAPHLRRRQPGGLAEPSRQPSAVSRQPEAARLRRRAAGAGQGDGVGPGGRKKVGTEEGLRVKKVSPWPNISPPGCPAGKPGRLNGAARAALRSAETALSLLPNPLWPERPRFPAGNPGVAVQPPFNPLALRLVVGVFLITSI